MMKKIEAEEDTIDSAQVYNALVEYIESNQNRFYLLAYSYSKNQSTALDIVQASIYKALTSIDGLKNPHHMRTWFYRIVVNTSLDELRKNSKFFPIDPNDFSEDLLQQASIVESAIDMNDRIDLYEALCRLDPKSRTLINLRFFEDMKISDIAEVLEESISSVKSRLYRTLSKLKIQLDWEEM